MNAFFARFSGWLKSGIRFFTGQKLYLIAAVAFAVILVFSFPLVNRFFSSVIPSNRTFNGISLVAEKEDAAGVDTKSRFVFTNKGNVDVEDIRANLSVTPLANFSVQKKDSRTAIISFSRPLKGNTVYVFHFTSSGVSDRDAHADEKNEGFSWAFQTKETFQVLSTVPGDHTTDVPLNGGIEITFSHGGVKNLDSEMIIEPAVEGDFSYNNNKTVVFVPKTLLAKTIYTVTIKKGLKSEDRPDALDEDFVFRFETGDPSSDPSLRVRPIEITSNEGYEGSVQEFSTKNTPAFSVFSDDSKPVEQALSVNVYRFSTVEDFLSMLGKMNEAKETSGWSIFSNRYRYDTSKLQKVASFKAEIKSFGWKKIVAFPEPLPAGWYVFDVALEDPNDSQNQQVAFQVTDIAAYSVSSVDKGFIWLNDASGNAPVANATAELISSEGKKKMLAGKSDEKGILGFENAEISFGKVFEEKDADMPDYVKVTDPKQRIILLPAVRKTQPISVADRYWSYIYVDREQYQPTDTVKFWGVVRDRTKEKPGKLQLRLLVDGGTRYERTVETNENGTIVGEIPLNNWEGGELYGRTYRLSLAPAQGEYEGEDIVSQYFPVIEYDKKAYKINVVAQKKGYFSGEEAEFSGRVEYFDATGIPGRKLECVLGSIKKETETDKDGKFTCKMGTESNRFGVSDGELTVRPIQAEVSEIYGFASTNIVPGSSGLSLETEKKDGKLILAANTYRFDMEKFNRDANYRFKDYPEGGKKVNVSVTEVYYERKETGEHYDFIEKRSVKEYDYEQKKKKIGDFELVTSGTGVGYLSDVVSVDKQYEIEAVTIDDNGREWKTIEYVYGWLPGYAQDENTVFLKDEKTESRGNYALGETVRMTLTRYGGDINPAEGNRVLFYRAQGGLIDTTVSEAGKYSFDFSSAELPNADVIGVWWDGKTLRSATQNVFFETETRKLDVEIRPDAGEYRPGQQAKLDIAVKDKDGNGRSGAAVNVNIVDEAAGGTAVPLLRNLYSYKDTGLTFPYTSHAYPEQAMAEQGGCFVGGTLIRMADGSEKPIEAIRVGDEILTRENIFSSKTVSSRVTEIFKHRVGGYLDINGTLGVTPEHILWVNGTWKTANEVHVGDMLLGSDDAVRRARSIRLMRTEADVYNFTVAGTHTYFASELYVHNCKGGDCGRVLFPDHIYFGETLTDDSGKAQVSVALPDSITSWDVRAQAVSKDLFFGDASASLPVSLPFFVDFDVSREYLTGDEPILSLRSFGKALSGGENVSYSVSAPSLGITEQKIDSTVFQTAAWKLNALTQGDHVLTVDARSGGLHDRITKTIHVISSHVQRKMANVVALSDATRVIGDDKGQTRLVISDERANYLFALLQNLYWGDSIRLDAMVARIEARKILKDRFHQAVSGDEDFSRSMFQKEDGGIAAVSYGGSDLFLSYLLALLGNDEYYSRDSLANYFETIAQSENSSHDNVSLALAGLAALHEPVLLDIREKIANNKTSFRNKLVLATGLASLGDQSGARKVAQEILSDDQTQKSPDGVWSVKREGQKTADDILSDTALMADLCALSGLTEEAMKFGLYVSANSSDKLPLFLDKLLLADRLSRGSVSGKTKSFTYTMGGERKQKTLNVGEVFELVLDPEQLKEIRFEKVDAGLRATSLYREKPSGDLEKSSAVRVKREYSANGDSKTVFSGEDVIRVRISYDFSLQASDGCYQVTDFLPTGFRYMATRSYGDEKLSGRSPESVNGNQMSFCAFKNDAEKYVEYFARVSGKGKFTAEGIAVQSLSQISQWTQFDSTRIDIQ